MEPESLQKRLDPKLIHLPRDPVQGIAAARRSSSPSKVAYNTHIKHFDPGRTVFTLLSRDAFALGWQVVAEGCSARFGQKQPGVANMTVQLAEAIPPGGVGV